MLIRLLILSGVIHLYGIQAIIIETPRNIAVVEGSSIQLNCSSNDTRSPIRWIHRRTDSSEKTTVHAGIKFTNKNSSYSIDNTNLGEYNLRVNSASMYLAGLYTCNEFRTRFNACAEVTVLAPKEPVCNFSAIYSNMSDHNGEPAGGTLILRCRTVYRGNWAPSLKILSRTVAIESSNITITEKDVTAMVTVPLEACDNNRPCKFQCIVTFERSQRMPRNDSERESYANNIPDYFVSIHLEYPHGAGESQSTCNTISTTSEIKNKDLTSLQVAAVCRGVVLFIGMICVIVLFVQQRTRIARNEDSRPLPQPLYEITKCATNVETSVYQELRPTS